MQVRLFHNNPNDAQLWDDFVREFPGATSDHLWGWREVLTKSFRFREAYYLGVMREEKVTGVLPLYCVPDGFRGRQLISIPFANYGGICAEDSQTAETLVQAAGNLARQIRCAQVELRHLKPQQIKGTSSQPSTKHSRFFLSLTNDEDAQFIKLGQNLRSKVRRAKKRGLRSFVSRDVRQLYPVYTHTSKRQGTPCFPRSYFEEILRVFSEDSEILFVARENKVIAFYLIIYFKDRALFQLCGSYSEEYSNYPNEFIYWEALKRCIEKGVRKVDFGRSRVDSGCAAFKRNLRYQELPHAYEYVFSTKEQDGEEESEKSKFRWAMKAWQQLPEPVANYLGPKVLRYFS